MKIIITVCFFIIVRIPLSFAQPAELRLAGLADILVSRIKSKKKLLADPFPCLRYDSTLIVNARYERPCIVVGPIQRTFSTTDDTLSILYHEYQHHLMAREGRYPVAYDENGNIRQWDTGESYIYQPAEEEVELQLQHFLDHVLPSYPHAENMPDSVKGWHVAQMRRDLSRPHKMAFIYAPSNLALEEIVAYQKQLAGERMGLYSLSERAKISINIRLMQLRDTYKRRKRYERLHHLNSDGSNQH